MRNNTKLTTNMIARKAMASAKGLAALLMGTFLLSGCEQMGDLDDIIGDDDGGRTR